MVKFPALLLRMRMALTDYSCSTFSSQFVRYVFPASEDRLIMVSLSLCKSPPKKKVNNLTWWRGSHNLLSFFSVTAPRLANKLVDNYIVDNSQSSAARL